MYNGYRNWETWNCVLWLTNEEGTYFYYRALAKQLSRLQLAEAIEANITDNIPEQLTGLYSDLLNKTLQEIDYIEVAEAFIEME